MDSREHNTGNRIVDLLPRDESSRLLRSAAVVEFSPGQVIYEPDGSMPHVSFPTTSVTGIVVLSEEGKQLEGTPIGKDGMIGLPLFLGLDFHPFVAVTNIPGKALQVPAATFLQMARRGSTLDRLLRRYTVYRLRCANQTAACRSLHAVEERMARWLLMARDRAGQDAFPLTHETLANLLGVRRQTVSLTAGALQRAGLITYHRGILRVLDREGLKAASCECYEVLKRLYERIVQP